MPPGNDQPNNPLSRENIIKHALQMLENPGDALLPKDNNPDTDNTPPALFTIKTAREWTEEAMTLPVPRMLFSEFWHQGELCILFADTNVGKSILAVQLGDSISSGIAIPGFQLEAMAQPVLYFDFELSGKQFEARYSSDFEHHYFMMNHNEYFLRAEMNPADALPAGFANFEDYLIYSLEQGIGDSGAKVLIIDNITYLKNENEQARDALPLMKQLNGLKKKYGLSILALAHTPKRDLSKPLTRNDLQGSKMLINFCDSAFAIGESSQENGLRYIKQIKARHTEVMYNGDNVCLCNIGKPYNFLAFHFAGFGTEYEHLKQVTEDDRQNQINLIITMHKEGKTLREIGNTLGISFMKVKRLLDKHLKL